MFNSASLQEGWSVFEVFFCFVLKINKPPLVEKMMPKINSDYSRAAQSLVLNIFMYLGMYQSVCAHCHFFCVAMSVRVYSMHVKQNRQWLPK